MARQDAGRSWGEKIGKLQDVYFDVENDAPQLATVKEGLIGRHLTFVPLGGITVGPDDLQVAVTSEQVKSAPNIEQHGEELWSSIGPGLLATVRAGSRVAASRAASELVQKPATHGQPRCPWPRSRSPAAAPPALRAA